MSEIERIVTSQTTTGTSSSTTAGASSASKSDNTIFAGTKKKDLTQEEIKLLKSLGIDPNDTAAVEQWRALPEEQRTAQLNQYYMQSEANKGTAPQTPQNTTQQPSASSPVTPEADVSAQSSATPAAQGADTSVSTPTTPAATTQTSQQATTQTAAPTTQQDGTTAPSAQAAPAATTPTTPASAQTTADTPDAATQSAAPQAQGAAEKMPGEAPAPIKMEDLPTLAETLAPSADLEKITIKKMDILQNTSEEQWKSYSEEQRLFLLQDSLDDQFKEELKGMDSKQRYEVITGLIDNEIKKERGLSDEKWDSFSDDKKLKYRLKYGTSFAIAIKKGYTREDLENLSSYERSKAELEAYNELKTSFLSQFDSASIDQATLKRYEKIDKQMQEQQESMDVVDALAEFSQNQSLNEYVVDEVGRTAASAAVNTHSAAVADAIIETANTVKSEVAPAENTKKNSYLNKFEEEIGLKSSDIKPGDIKAERKYEKELSKALEKDLQDKTPEERDAFYKELILNNSGDKDQLMHLVNAMRLAGKDQVYFTEMTDVMRRMGNKTNLQKNERQQVQNLLNAAIETTDKDNDNTKATANLADTAMGLDDTKAAREQLEKLEGTTKDHTETIRRYARNTNFSQALGKGVLGKTVRTFKLPEAKIKSTAVLAEYEHREDITEAMKPAEGEKPDGKLQLKQQAAALAANPKSVVVNQALKDATPFIAKDATSEYFEIGFKATENLEGKDTQIEAQKGWSDIIKHCDASVQGDLFETTMTSKYDEVLEYASSNIYQLDESVQAEAIKLSYDTGNQKAIDAVNAQLDKCDAKAVEAVGSDVIERQTQATESRYTQEVAQEVAEFNQKYQELTGTTAQENLLPDADEQKMAFVQSFLSATPQEQYKLISKIPQAWQGTVFSKICQYCPNLLTGLVKQGYGKQILKTPGMPSDVIYKVINTMLTCGASDKRDASKYVTDHKYLFTESTLERCEEILAGSKGREKIYSSTPMNGGVQSALQPGMSAIYPGKKAMFYKA